MKDSLSSSISMLRDDTNDLDEQHTPAYRLISNPFDPPSSVHLKQRLASFSIFNEPPQENTSTVDVLSIERRAQVNPHRLSEHIVQIDTSLFNEEMRDRYQRASDHFCHTHLDLPTPILPTNPISKTRNQSWSSSSSNSSLDQTRHTRHMACQTRLSLPPAADLDSLIQSFASTSDPDDPPQIIGNSSLNISQIRRKLFSDDDDLLDETTPIAPPPRRSSSFDNEQRSSSPSQQPHRDTQLHRHTKPVTPDCSPIPLKTSTNSTKTSQQYFLSVTPQRDAVVMTSVSRPTRYVSIHSSPISNMSIGSPFLHPPQMPSDYARQVLDNALAELMECSM